jgi:hypothetical protein
MKAKLFFLFVLINAPVFAQKLDASKVPGAVKNAFVSHFPAIKAEKWEKEKNNYEANFTSEGKKMAALFNSKGEWLETEKAIEKNELPAGVLAYVQKNYKGAIKETARIEKVNDVNYEVNVNSTDLIFDSKGNFLKAVKD